MENLNTIMMLMLHLNLAIREFKFSFGWVQSGLYWPYQHVFFPAVPQRSARLDTKYTVEMQSGVILLQIRIYKTSTGLHCYATSLGFYTASENILTILKCIQYFLLQDNNEPGITLPELISRHRSLKQYCSIGK